MIGTTEIIIIAGVVLVLFGSAAIPKFARSLGRARKEFEEGIKEGMREGEARPDKPKESPKIDGKG